MEKTEDQTEVHVAASGQPLCKFSEIEGDWPDGHSWVSVRADTAEEEANCQRCLKKMKGRRKR